MGVQDEGRYSKSAYSWCSENLDPFIYALLRINRYIFCTFYVFLTLFCLETLFFLYITYFWVLFQIVLHFLRAILVKEPTVLEKD